MTEQDKQFVERIRSRVYVHDKDTRNLLSIIDSLEDERIKQHDTIMNYRDEVGFLKKQLTEVVEAGEPLQRLFEGYSPPQSHDDRFYFTPIEKAARRLSQKLKDVKHE